jgi:hypothetical protein
MLACWKMLRYVSPLRGSGFPRKPITGVGTPGYCMPRLQRSGPRPPTSLLSAASMLDTAEKSSRQAPSCRPLFKICRDLGGLPGF